jgi:hypothetical protein
MATETTSSRHDSTMDETSENSSSKTASALKFIAACAFMYSGFATWSGHGTAVFDATSGARRQLSVVGDTIPSYMEALLKDLRERQKLFEETPPEEVKYWFEYTGPLQVCGAFHSSPSWLCTCALKVVSYVCFPLSSLVPEIFLPLLQVSWQGGLF